MLLQIVQSTIEFLETSAPLIAVVMAIVEYVKRVVQDQEWYVGWYMTIFAFVVSFLFAIPEAGFVGIDWVMYIAHGIGLGLVATGIYKVSSTVVRKAMG